MFRVHFQQMLEIYEWHAVNFRCWLFQYLVHTILQILTGSVVSQTSGVDLVEDRTHQAFQPHGEVCAEGVSADRAEVNLDAQARTIRPVLTPRPQKNKYADSRQSAARRCTAFGPELLPTRDAMAGTPAASAPVPKSPSSAGSGANRAICGKSRPNMRILASPRPADVSHFVPNRSRRATRWHASRPHRPR